MVVLQPVTVVVAAARLPVLTGEAGAFICSGNVPTAYVNSRITVLSVYVKYITRTCGSG